MRKTVCEGRCLLTLTNTPAPKQLRLRYGKRRHAGQNDNAHSQKNEFGREICDFKIAASEEPKSSNRKSPLFVQVSRRQWTTGDDRLLGLESHPLRHFCKLLCLLTLIFLVAVLVAAMRIFPPHASVEESLLSH